MYKKGVNGSDEEGWAFFYSLSVNILQSTPIGKEFYSETINSLEQRVKSLEELSKLQQEEIKQLITKYEVVKNMDHSLDKRFQSTNSDIRDLYDAQTELNEKLVTTQGALQRSLVSKQVPQNGGLFVKQYATKATQTDVYDDA